VSKHRFVLLISGTILVSLVLVAVSLGLYNASGAAQVDLSRPDYKSIRSQVTTDDDTVQSYPSTGTIDSGAIDDFRSLYDAAAKDATSASVFNDTALSNRSLGISSKSATDSN